MDKVVVDQSAIRDSVSIFKICINTMYYDRHNVPYTGTYHLTLQWPSTRRFGFRKLPSACTLETRGLAAVGINIESALIRILYLTTGHEPTDVYSTLPRVYTEYPFVGCQRRIYYSES